MASSTIAEVTPRIIKWAREHNTLTHKELAETVGVHENQIIKWEQGTTKPTFNQAGALAKALRIPFGYLFLSEPPALEVPLPDLRTRSDRRLLKISESLREVLYGALDRQEWYREYITDFRPRKLTFVGKFTLEGGPMKVAGSIRRLLAVNQPEREKARTQTAYLNSLIDKAEHAGILVMRSSVVGNDTSRSLSTSDFQGFVITDEIAPVIFINGADFVSAQIFTLIHELAHIWIGQSGISNIDEASISHSKHQTVESFCNTAAVEVLVPESEFLKLWPEHEREFYKLAGHFWVSPLVVLRRAFELNKIRRDEFFAVLNRMKSDRTRTKGRGLGKYYINVATRHSPTVMELIIKDVQSGGTLIRDGARLLDMAVPTFAGFVEGTEY